jgi:ankyrin repeat protein
LIQAGANINDCNCAGDTALDVAIDHGHRQVVRQLLAAHGHRGEPHTRL